MTRPFFRLLFVTPALISADAARHGASESLVPGSTKPATVRAETSRGSGAGKETGGAGRGARQAAERRPGGPGVPGRSWCLVALSARRHRIFGVVAGQWKPSSRMSRGGRGRESAIDGDPSVYTRRL
ncbi:MAG: hypothetical protein AVDCRST_MAG02-1268 [uncultured Rubrobacteraceae bacterium]|uniref:Uncharacterized protein n=1 Tax=uncultured Rubrobacteraceae bacterium TaxID=349277 RepID=A0A6J4QSR9_9ACTN|nr:MAG: hypothetical protein AVDCRST_MAG02-1268 [uncultured Rubrobacteraceae bacterium]